VVSYRIYIGKVVAEKWLKFKAAKFRRFPSVYAFLNGLNTLTALYRDHNKYLKKIK